MPKVSLIIPSIRPQNWPLLVSDMAASCVTNSWEIIFVGPKMNNDISFYAVKMIRDFGSPSRCFQIGASIAEGDYIAFCSDDCRITPSGFNMAIMEADAKMGREDGMTLLYSEGADYGGNQHEQPEYWIAHTHTDLRLPGVDPTWLINPTFMYRRDFFYEMGGMDCSFEHMNMNIHDLAFAVQGRGGRIIKSPSRVFQFNWTQSGVTPEYQPVFNAFVANDRPLIQSLYSNPMYSKLRDVRFDNWRQQPAIWQRRQF
jgi:glycosyltransferase involved in cell wall biosynthesis